MFEIEPKYLYLQSDISFWICFALVPTCKRLRPGAVPTINLPKKSIPSTSTTATRHDLRQPDAVLLKP